MNISTLTDSIPLINKNIWEIGVPQTPQQIYVGVQDGYCNLKCPMCFFHSSSNKRDVSKLRGKMPFSSYCKILDELKGSMTSINPYRFTEPLLIANLKECIIAAKGRGLPFLLDTNGLLLTKDMADFIVQAGVDSITFSIDAVSNDTLKRVRGVEDIDKIIQSVFMMLEARGTLKYPRIGVSFVLSEANSHEEKEFIDFWIQHVDVIRVNRVFNEKKEIYGIPIPRKRVPCYALYSKMVIDFKGDVTICTTDAFNSVCVGNVFKECVIKVWNGDALAEVRYYHETGRFDKLPFCKECNLWADYSYQDVIENGVLIRKSNSVVYYNRLDKLATWKIQQMGRSSQTSKKD